MPRVKTPTGLTEKMRRFVSEYTIDGAAERSAIAAGYPPAGARSQATRLLQNPAVRAEIDKATDRVAGKAELTAAKVLSDIARIAQAAEDCRRYGDALKGYELLGRYLKLFTDKLEHGGPGGGPLLFDKIVREVIDPSK